MRKVLALGLLVGIAATAAPAQQSAPAQKAALPEMSRSDLDMARLEGALTQKRRELFAAGMAGLTAAHQEAFWKTYADFEKEKDALGAKRMNLLKSYVENFATLSEADVTKMVNEAAAIQQQTGDLRMKYFGILTPQIGAKAAARFAHIDDYLTTVWRLTILDNMPALQAN